MTWMIKDKQKEPDFCLQTAIYSVLSSVNIFMTQVLTRCFSLMTKDMSQQGHMEVYLTMEKVQ